MATLEKIRNLSGLLVGVVGLALFAFIIGDFLNSGSSYFRTPPDQVAKVEGTAINYNYYQSRIEEMTNVYKMGNNMSNLPEEYLTQIRQSVYTSLVQEIVLNGALDKLGIKVTPEELFDMIQGENVSSMVQQIPLFADPQTGVFNKARALNILKTIENMDAVPQEQRAELENVRNYWLFWERNIKQQRLQEKYTALLSRAIVANPLDARNAYEGGLESSDIVYAMQPYATVADSLISVSDAEVKRLYDQRKEQFRQKEARMMDYISVDIRPSEEDFQQVSKDIEQVKTELATTHTVTEMVNIHPEMQYLDAFKPEKAWDLDVATFLAKAEINDVEGPVFKDDSYRLCKLVDKTVAPDSVKVSHIFLTAQSGADVQALADSLLNVLTAGGSFEELAAAWSADQQSAANGGEVGWITEEIALTQIGEDFKNTLFSAELNRPVIAKTQAGTHIVKITEKTAAVPKYKVADITLKVTPSTKTYGLIYNELNQFLAKNNSAEKIRESARDAGYSLVPNVRVTTEDRTIASVPDSRQVVRWAFEGSGRDEVSTIFECRSHFVIAIRKSILPEGYQPFESVAPMLRYELVGRKKGEKIVEELKAKNLQTLEACAMVMNATPDTVKFINMNTSRITGIGMEPVLNAEIAYAPENQLTGPVAGANGVYVFIVTNRVKEAREYDEQQEARTLEAGNAYRVGYQAVQALVDKATVVDRRIRFD
ncbi:MAG: SurA N-terminal domain-containing protein [Tannerella sp.]|jgi:peptidyl-prolyl cis-trans isomerase D|nr:SurA N-terminal domain-containing protein [Tannerella sp.]